ncbi:limonene-1,2-epoxide hydrolase [Mycolicibacterium iranicum]|uniref:Limonene-1,2-epoxide hydrolase n=1 Tax=Mycolicibacterium iranicum TaxID=912594 RepID=A0A839Q5K6_MYCIR|nr:limonene-1,2-epoxide hydrolase family protein [Mycolicibacterium iranicum]MBB2990164.1 limonene-1,2-epoxide hydrolase [Mycolicibacterium iranicum]
MTDEAPEGMLPTAATNSVDTTSVDRKSVDNREIVRRFLLALEAEDIDTVESLAAPELVWQNVGLPSIRGRRRIVTMLRKGVGRYGFAVKFHRITAEGGTVLNERTDAIIIGPLRLQFWVCGIFEVDDAGQITLWRDYFDMLDVMVKAPLRAIAGAVIPALRPRF